LGIRSSGSPILASAIGMNKQICSFLVSEWGHTVPAGCLASDLAKMGSPAWSQFEGTSRFIAKPIHGGDSFGIQVFDDTALLIHAIQTMDKRQQLQTRIEAFIDGAIGTIGLLSVGGELLIGDCIRIDLPEGKQFYDTSLKWGLGEPVKRAGFDAPMEEHITTSAADIYERLGCSSLARIDFIVSGGLLYFLEVNTNPGLYVGSNADLSFRNQFEFQQLLALIILAGSDAATNGQGYP
jgi:D-alanine-D-alanine ligase